jgi:GDP-L-fucose synthase
LSPSLQSRRVVVTGGSGFLGSHVVEELHARGVREVVVPRSAQWNLTDAVAAHAMLEQTRPDLVIHLAASVGGIGKNRRLPGTFFRDNMAMGLNLLEAARRLRVSKVVVAGTICSYPKFAPVPFREDDLWNGYPEETNAPYGIAKKAILVMAQAYRQEFGCNFVMVLPVNLYGPRDNFDLEDSHVIPAMIRKFVEAERAGQKRVVLWGDGSPTREFLYVADAARGLVDAAERYDDPDPVNLGAGFEISIHDLAVKVARAVGYSGSIEWDAARPNGQPRRMLDISRARERLGFAATTDLDTGLSRTIAWFKEHGGAVT